MQMVSGTDVQANLDSAAGLIRRAVADRASFLLLPENFALMGRQEQDKLRIMEAYGQGPIQAFLSDQARQHRIWLMGGTIPLKADTVIKVRAACLLYDPQGACIEIGRASCRERV